MPSIPISLRIALLRARMLAKRHVDRAIRVLARALLDAGQQAVRAVDLAIAAVARFHAAAA